MLLPHRHTSMPCALEGHLAALPAAHSHACQRHDMICECGHGGGWGFFSSIDVQGALHKSMPADTSEGLVCAGHFRGRSMAVAS